jgi:putative chitobiose transport system permease protein
VTEGGRAARGVGWRAVTTTAAGRRRRVSPAHRRPAWAGPNRDWRAGWGFALPAFVLLAIFVLFPLLQTARLSFTDYHGFGSAAFTGTDNYTHLAHDEVFRRTLLNSAVITGASTLLLTLVPLPVAYWLQRGIPFRRFFRTTLYVPVVLPIIVSSVAWKWVLSDGGLLNQVLQSTGIIERPISWLGDPHIAIWMVILVIFWRAFGIYLLIYLSGLATLPDELFEAALLDGANQRQIFTKIVVPLMRKFLVLSAVIAFVGSMRLFDEIYVLTGGGPVNSTKNTAYYIWERAFSFFDFGYASAAAVVLLVLVLALVLAGMRLANRDVTA